VGWAKRHFSEVTFDSTPERTLATRLDGDPQITEWLRLANGDLEIPWGPERRRYNPDFLAYDVEGVTWILEVKSDKDANHEDVLAKRTAAIQWCRAVTTNSVRRREIDRSRQRLREQRRRDRRRADRGCVGARRLGRRIQPDLVG